MNILTYGEIIENGKSIFSVIVKIENNSLSINFSGEIRVKDPYKELEFFLENFSAKLKDQQIEESIIDFLEFEYCNSNGFYIIMDIIDILYNNFKGNIIINRLIDDDWHQETLPILLRLEDSSISERIVVNDCKI